MIIGIVCTDKNWAIGKDNKLLFNLSADMKFFRQKTMGKVVVCGRKTLLSFPGEKPLWGRSTLVLSSSGFERNDCMVFHSKEELIRLVVELSKTQDVYIIGGASIYNLFLPYYNKVYVTMVEAVIEDADTFFPNLFKHPEFDCNFSGITLEENGYRFQFDEFNRNNSI